MTRKTKILEGLAIYFMEKGKVLTVREYKAQKDQPYKISLIKQYVGSWSRLARMIKKNFPEEYAEIYPDSDKDPVHISVLTPVYRGKPIKPKEEEKAEDKEEEKAEDKEEEKAKEEEAKAKEAERLAKLEAVKAAALAKLEEKKED